MTATALYGMYLLKFSPTSDENSVPIADAGLGLYVGDEDAPIAFDASGSFDPDNLDADPDNDQILAYVWDFGDGTSATTVDPITSVDHAYQWGDTFSVTLTVNDGNGGFATDTTTAIVTEVNDTPVADPGGPYSANVGTTVTFDGSDSYDPDNEDGTAANDQTLTYAWDFGGGATATGIVVTHTFDTAGDHDVTLTVTDTDNDPGFSSVVVSMADASAALTIDDGDLGYREVGYNNDTPYVPWLDPASGDGGYAGLDGEPDYRIAASKRSSCPKGPGQFICESFAYWDFAGLPTGPYEVLVTWVAQTDNATRAPFAVIDTDAAWLFKTNKVDQTKDPVGTDGFQSLGTYTITGNTLAVRLSNDANGTVVADAVRIIPLSTSSTSSALAAPLDSAVTEIAAAVLVEETSGGSTETLDNPSSATSDPVAVDNVLRIGRTGLTLVDSVIGEVEASALSEHSVLDETADEIGLPVLDEGLLEDLAMA